MKKYFDGTYMCSSVVLCGDCLISFLTSCIPKNVETKSAQISLYMCVLE